MTHPDKSVQHADRRAQEGFVMLPRAVAFDSSLSVGARLLYAILKSYAWQAEECWAGMETLCEALGSSFNTVKKYRDELVDGGLLHVEKRGQGRTNVMWIIEPWKALNLTFSGSASSSVEGEVKEEEVEEALSPLAVLEERERQRRGDNQKGEN